MFNSHRIRSALRVTATLGLMLFLPLGAQSDAGSDEREIDAYRLTESGLAKYTRAMQNLGPLAKKMSEDCNDGRDDGESEDDGNANSIDESVASFEAIPGVRAAIQSAGMTTRDYIVFTWSLFQSGMAAWALDQPGGKLPPNVAMDNVTFYRKHEEALKKLGEETKPAECGDDEAEESEAVEE